MRASLTIATAFGCSVEGEIPPERVVAMARSAVAIGFDEIVLGDTVGHGNPRQVGELFAEVARALPGVTHVHDTRGLGCANAFAAYEPGVSIFDASFGGLGGCPFAKGALGNVATEDLVNMFASMGGETEIELDAVVANGRAAGPLLGHSLDSAMSRATAAAEKRT